MRLLNSAQIKAIAGGIWYYSYVDPETGNTIVSHCFGVEIYSPEGELIEKR